MVCPLFLSRLGCPSRPRSYREVSPGLTPLFRSGIPGCSWSVRDLQRRDPLPVLDLTLQNEVGSFLLRDSRQSLVGRVVDPSFSSLELPPKSVVPCRRYCYRLLLFIDVMSRYIPSLLLYIIPLYITSYI